MLIGPRKIISENDNRIAAIHKYSENLDLRIHFYTFDKIIRFAGNNGKLRNLHCNKISWPLNYLASHTF